MDKQTYRVFIDKKSNTVQVLAFGLPCDASEEGYYSSVHELPQWMQDRLAVLIMLPVPPPEQRVENIGERISDHVYWLFKPLEEGVT